MKRNLVALLSERPLYHPQKENFWIVKLFTEDINSRNLNAAKKEWLIKLVWNTKLKIK